VLRLREGGERIPLMWVDFERQRGSVTVLVQTLGKTASEMPDNHAEGEALDGFVGPLGPLGPPPMMHACTDTARPYRVRTMVSLNPIMVDGAGMRGSGRVTLGGEAEAGLRGQFMATIAGARRCPSI
jgi:NAD(P)H-flavin reductase